MLNEHLRRTPCRSVQMFVGYLLTGLAQLPVLLNLYREFSTVAPLGLTKTKKGI